MSSQQQSMNYIILVKDQALKIQQENIEALNMISSILSSCLGPLSLQKLIITKIGSLEITNDGHSILREIDVTHPAAKSIVELARTQDDEVGDGTTSVIILAAAVMRRMGKLLFKKYHPVKICAVLNKALKVSMECINKNGIEVKNKELVHKIVSGTVATKICTILGMDIASLAIRAVDIVYDDLLIKKVDIKNLAKVEKIFTPGYSGSEVLNGIIINKTLIHPQMRKRIENPRILILDTPLEYKKGESQTNYEFHTDKDFTRALKIEEEQIEEMCKNILKIKPDIVITEKGMCDYAISIFYQNNITALRRFKKTETLRLSKCTGGLIASRTEDLTEKYIGKGCNLFDYEKIGDEYYCKFISDKPKACSVILKGPSKDILNELERNFYDAVKVAKNIKLSPKMCVGGGATEMMIANELKNSREFNTEFEKDVIEELAEAIKIIPITLAKNSGIFDPLSMMAELENKQSISKFYGIDGINGKVEDMREIIMEPLAVKEQCLKSAIEAVILLLRVDGVIQSKKKK